MLYTDVEFIHIFNWQQNCESIDRLATLVMQLPYALYGNMNVSDISWINYYFNIHAFMTHRYLSIVKTIMKPVKTLSWDYIVRLDAICFDF